MSENKDKSAESSPSGREESGEAPYVDLDNHVDTNAGPDAKMGTVADMPDDPEEAK